MHYTLKIEMLSETIMGTGSSVPGSVDTEILYDEIGLPYIKGKTIKGNLREHLENAEVLLNFKNSAISKILMGRPGIYDPEFSILNFSDAKVSDVLSREIARAVETKSVYKEEIKEALTNDRGFTRIKDGIAMDKTLRNIRTINPGLILNCEIYSARKLDVYEQGILACGARMMMHIGLMRSRGKGQIKCSLIYDKRDITQESILSMQRGMTK